MVVVDAMQVERIVTLTSLSSRKCWTTLQGLSVCWPCLEAPCCWPAVVASAGELLSCLLLTCTTWSWLLQRLLAATALSSSRVTWKRLMLCCSCPTNSDYDDDDVDNDGDNDGSDFIHNICISVTAAKANTNDFVYWIFKQSNQHPNQWQKYFWNSWMARVGPGHCCYRIGPIHFLAGWHKKRPEPGLVWFC